MINNIGYQSNMSDQNPYYIDVDHVPPTNAVIQGVFYMNTLIQMSTTTVPRAHEKRTSVTVRHPYPISELHDTDSSTKKQRRA